MKIFSARQLKEADEITIKKQDISSLDLMERAASLVFEEIDRRLQGALIPIKIFCGIGNNGGDGLVVGRLLLEKGYDVRFYIVNYSDHRSKDFLANYDLVKKQTTKWPELLRSEDDFPEIKKGDFVVDAIFGVGLNRPLLPWVANLVKHINASEAFVLSIDLPSGLMADEPVTDKTAIIKAGYTITFQSPKMSFFLPETASFVGELQIMDIGLDREYLIDTNSRAELIGKEEAKMLYRPRNKFSHKGTFGHALMVGGSYGKMGSICLSATAALRSGIGMVTTFVPSCGYKILQTALPEAMVLTDKHENLITQVDHEIQPDVISFGVGVGTDELTIKAFEDLLQKTKSPMVIDADGLNILSKKKDLLKIIPEASILTPHPKELERLIGKWSNDFEKIEKAQAMAKEHKLILVLKDAYSMTLTAEDIYVNTSGNPGMATAGSGDVLTGILTSLLAQGYNPLTAAVFGVFLHGRAGDLAAEKLSYEGLIARDIAENTGAAILDLFKSKSNTNSNNLPNI